MKRVKALRILTIMDFFECRARSRAPRCFDFLGLGDQLRQNAVPKQSLLILIYSGSDRTCVGCAYYAYRANVTPPGPVGATGVVLCMF